MKTIRMLVIALLVCSLFGCATKTVVSDPKKITFEAAMEQVANGLNRMYDIGKDHPKSGLVPSEVTIDFNISADATDTGKLSIDAGANVLDPLQVTKAGAEIGSTIKAVRGNKITIKFTNIFVTDTKDSLIMVKKPEEIAQLLKTLKDAGYEPVYKKR